jgi:hypothetical protein
MLGLGIWAAAEMVGPLVVVTLEVAPEGPQERVWAALPVAACFRLSKRLRRKFGMVMGTQSQPGEAGKEGKQALSGSINIRDLFTRFYSMAPQQRAQIIDQLDPQSTAALKMFLPEPLATFLDEMGKSSGADVNTNIGDGARVPRPEDVDQMVEQVLKGNARRMGSEAKQRRAQQQAQRQLSDQIQSAGSESAPIQGTVAPRPGASNAQPGNAGEIMRRLGLG